MEILSFFISSFQVTNTNQESVYSSIIHDHSRKFGFSGWSINTVQAMTMMSVLKHAVLIIDLMKPINLGDFSVKHMLPIVILHAPILIGTQLLLTGILFQTS